MINEELFEKLQWIGTHTPGGFYIYRAEEPWEILYVNQMAIRLYGCETEEEFRALTGGTFRGMVLPEDFAEVQESIEKQVADKGNDNYDAVVYRIRRKDGEIRWVNDYGRLALTPEFGSVFYVFIVDSTERRRIREENERRASVIGGLRVDYEVICLYDLNTAEIVPFRVQQTPFTLSNKEMEDASRPENGWNNVVTRYAENFVIKEDRASYLENMRPEVIRARLENENSYSLDYRCCVEEGKVEYYRLTIVRVGEGPAEKAVIGYRNVSDQVRKAQLEMAEKMKIEMDLERQRRMNEIQSAFLFNVSHDLRTPMNAIIGFTDLAKRHIDDRELLVGYLDKVESSNRQLLGLIDDLLEMNRLRSGNTEVTPEPTVPREQVTAVLDLFSAEIERKRLKLEEHYALSDRQVMVDAHKMSRVIGNLISNAVKFTPNGGTVTISLSEEENPAGNEGRFKLTIADTGVGMTEEFMKKMFNAFEQEENSTRSGTTGTGIGLSIVKNLLELMGGEIRVRSEKGKGTEVTVEMSIPYASPGSAPEIKAAAVETAPESCRILLVEDIEINRLLAETILREAGFEVDSVADGTDAVEAVRSHAPWYYDLVLMDIQMPVMNGYEATRAIRALGRRDTRILPILALSANAREEDRTISLESGMNRHIAKPFDAGELIHVVCDEINASKRFK